FWFLFGYPPHTNSRSHYDSCCDPDYGYVYHHDNTHDEPFFHEQTDSEHYAAHHATRWVHKDEKAPCKERVVRVHRDDDRSCQVHDHCDDDCR
ncbi:MAG: hypothetical protein HY303_11425, partial [Candidatus Wallbacteria bacterium]|nr:hypothetical protein [Candidatus Wallbacteria bacterium]